MSSCSLVGHVPIQPQPRRFNRQQHSTLSHAARRPAPSGALRTIDRASRVVAQAKNPKPGSGVPSEPLEPSAVEPVAQSRPPLEPAGQVGKKGSSGKKVKPVPTTGAEEQAVYALEAAAVDALDAADEAADAAQDAGFQSGIASDSAVSDAADMVDGTAEAAKDLGKQANDAVDSAASDAADLADGAAEAAKDSGKQANDALDAAASDAADMADGAAEAAKDFGKQANDALETVASDAADVVGDTAKQAGDTLESAASDAADVAASVQSTVESAGQKVLDSAVGAANDAISGAAEVAGSVKAAAAAVEERAAKSSAAQSSVPVTAVPPPPIPSTPEAREAEVAATQKTLIGMLASLDRGAAASEDQAKRVEALAQQLERLSGPVVLSRVLPDGGGKSSMALLDGRWRLLYSSGFASGSLGGRRPGPSFGSGPFTLGQVYQDIMTEKLELDNVVDLFLRVSLAGLPGLNAAVPTAHARLKHTFSILGTNTVEITFTDTEVKLAGGLGGWLDLLPQFQLPSLPDALQPPKRSRSARFDVIFLDEQMRITRGDRGELRVFLKGET